MTNIYVIACVYNEAQNIESLLNGLQSQTYRDYNLVLIDDGSSDNTLSIIEKESKNLHFTDIFKTFKLIGSTHLGKDENIRRFLENIQEDTLILTTDADCMLLSTWVETMFMEYVATKASMLIGPVKIAEEYPFQATEFLSTQIVTRASALLGCPLMCGGANLAFTLDGYLRAKKNMPSGKSNGFDMYLLDAMKFTKQKIVAVNKNSATVVTKGKDTLSGFLKQRARWAGKALNYKNKSITITAALVLLLQLFFIATLFFIPFYPKMLLVWVVKVLMDIDMLLFMMFKMNSIKLILYILPVSIIYPFYVVTVSICTLFIKEK